MKKHLLPLLMILLLLAASIAYAEEVSFTGDWQATFPSGPVRLSLQNGGGFMMGYAGNGVVCGRWWVTEKTLALLPEGGGESLALSYDAAADTLTVPAGAFSRVAPVTGKWRAQTDPAAIEIVLSADFTGTLGNVGGASFPVQWYTEESSLILIANGRPVILAYDAAKDVLSDETLTYARFVETAE